MVHGHRWRNLLRALLEHRMHLLHHLLHLQRCGMRVND